MHRAQIDVNKGSVEIRFVGTTPHEELEDPSWLMAEIRHWF